MQHLSNTLRDASFSVQFDDVGDDVHQGNVGNDVEG